MVCELTLTMGTRLPTTVTGEDITDQNKNPANEFAKYLKLPLIKRLDRNGWRCWEQEEQLRMAPDQFAPANKVFYNGRIKIGSKLTLGQFPLAKTFEAWTFTSKEFGMGPKASTKPTTMTPSPSGLLYPMMADVRNSYCYRELGGTSRGNTQMCNTVMNYIKSFKD